MTNARDKWLSVAEVCARYGVHHATVYRRITRGTIRSERRYGVRVIDADDAAAVFGKRGTIVRRRVGAATASNDDNEGV